MNFYEKEPVSLFLDELSTLESYKSSKQKVELLKHPWLGKILIINGEIQHIEKYQCLYHELLVHLPVAFIPKIQSVLIIGGGSLFAAYEALKYPSVNNVTLCDHDPSVLELMYRHYSHAQSVMKDHRFHYIANDGYKFLENHTIQYDLVINDCLT